MSKLIDHNSGNVREFRDADAARKFAANERMSHFSVEDDGKLIYRELEGQSIPIGTGGGNSAETEQMRVDFQRAKAAMDAGIEGVNAANSMLRKEFEDFAKATQERLAKLENKSAK